MYFRFKMYGMMYMYCIFNVYRMNTGPVVGCGRTFWLAQEVVSYPTKQRCATVISGPIVGCRRTSLLQGYLAHEKQLPHMILQ